MDGMEINLFVVVVGGKERRHNQHKQMQIANGTLHNHTLHIRRF